MLVFLDTEYTDSLNCDLISIALVSEDGKHEFYAERTDYDRSWCNSFVCAAVLPMLGKTQNALNRKNLTVALGDWFVTLPSSVTIACDSFTDWELLLDAFGDERPRNLEGYFDLRKLAQEKTFNQSVVQYHEHSGPWHHALHDARAFQKAWVESQAQL